MVTENTSNPLNLQNSLSLDVLNLKQLDGLDVESYRSTSSFQLASPLDTLSLNIASAAQASSQSPFTSGIFTVGSMGQVGIDYLFDGGGYQGELAIFSLDGLESLGLGTPEFIYEIARRALSHSTLGHVVIFDQTEGARFSGELPWEPEFNAGDYLGVKTVTMRPGDTFGVAIVPNGTFQQVFDNLAFGDDELPLFSFNTANPNGGVQVGLIGDVTGEGHTFAFEDLRLDGESDRDYNDIVFQVRGASGYAGSLDQLIDPNRDWRTLAIGQALLAYAAPYDDPQTVQTVDYNFPASSQPLIGIIDTGFSANNPDINYSRLILGSDRLGNDNNPLLVPGEGNEHGTHILGIIGATQNNGIGIDGINDKAPIWLGRAIGSGQWSDVLTEFVTAHIASNQTNAVVNLSLDLTQKNPDGSTTTRYEFTPAERAAIEFARQHNVLLVVAAGNDGGVMSALGQASQEFDNIITVGAASDLNRADYSSYGDGLDILAPGGTTENGIFSTVGDGVGTLAGTSVATAYVTGVASQVWAANPELNYRQVIEILKLSATDLDAPNWDAETGAGLVNLNAATKLARAVLPQIHEAPASVIPDTWSGENILTASERAVLTGMRPYTFGSLGTLDDTLWEIAQRELGSGWRWVEIRKANGTPYTSEQARQIQRGTIVYLPLSNSNPNPVPNPPQNPNPIPNPNPNPIGNIPVDTNSANYRNGKFNPYAYNSALIGQCTWYAYGRMAETGLLPANAKSRSLFLGNAANWRNDALRAGLPVTSTPTPGARGLVVWPPNTKGASQYGHVAFLEEVYPDGRIRISEANWKNRKSLTLNPVDYAGVSFVQLENARINPSTSSPPAIPGQQQQYIIKSGDTLSQIAQRYLGNGNRWREIKKADGSTFTDAEARSLRVGQSVYLPISYRLPPLPVPPSIPQPKPIPKFEQPRDGWGYVTRPGEFYRVGLERVDGSMSDIRDRQTWIVIHGMNGSPKNGSISNLASVIGNYRNDDQVFTLDWSTAAFSNSQLGGLPNPKFGASWITQVAEFVTKKVQEWGISALNNINVVGHSLGSFVSYEVAKKLGNINRLIALDPATTTNGGYTDSTVDFSNYSNWAWGFYGSSFGSDKRAQTAEESFKFDFGGFDPEKHHGAVVRAFTEMLEKNKDNQAGNVSRLFDLNQMTNPGGKPWQRHDGFEAVLKPKEEGSEWKPESLSYYAGMNNDSWWNPWDERWNSLKEA